MKKIIKYLLSPSIKNIIKKYVLNNRATSKNIKIIEHMELDFIFQDFIQRKLKMLEIGSHKGEIFNIIQQNNFSHKFHIVCIEPNPESFKVLKKSIQEKLKILQMYIFIILELAMKIKF